MVGKYSFYKIILYTHRAATFTKKTFTSAEKGPVLLESQYKSKLLRALVSILKPLIRLCLRHEITHAELNELMRMTYVQVAYERYSIPGIDMTMSRAAVLTGLSRKEVGRLREALENSDFSQKQTPNKAQSVSHGWLNDAEFTDRNGLPLTLPIRQKKDGKEYGSFVALVKRYSSDVTYGAILDELNHVGVVEQPDDNTVALTNYAYVPHQDSLESTRVVTTSVSDLFDTGLHNIECETNNKRFQRQVVYSHIHESFVDEIEQSVAQKAQALLETLNSEIAIAKKKSANKNAEELRRIGFGMYYFDGRSVKPASKGKRPRDQDV